MPDFYTKPVHPKSKWTEDRLKVVYDRYIVAGEPADVVAADLGVSAAALRRRVADEPTWTRDKSFEMKNRAASDELRIASRRKNQAAKAEALAAQPTVRRQPFTLHKTPVNWSRPAEDNRALGDRILDAIKNRPLPASTIACLVGSKEHYVGIQLAALAATGAVQAGPAVDVGPRNRLWSAAA